ncbi:IS3 family transposase [Rhodococcus koreensis]
MWLELRGRGVRVGRKRVERIMRENGRRGDTRRLLIQCVLPGQSRSRAVIVAGGTTRQ